MPGAWPALPLSFDSIAALLREAMSLADEA